MMVMEKRRDIAILKAMGATRRAIMKIFVLQGLIIGTVGTVWAPSEVSCWHLHWNESVKSWSACCR